MGDLFTTWFGPKRSLPEDIPFGPKHVVHKSPIYIKKSFVVIAFFIFDISLYHQNFFNRSNK